MEIQRTKTTAVLVVAIAAVAVVFFSQRKPRVRPSSTSCRLGLLAPCQRECSAGLDRSCEVLTRMYLKGLGVPRSESKAAFLNKRLCESGRTYFCPSYAFTLYEGNGLAKDRKRARQLFREHCQHDPTACGEFGSLYLGGRGVERDPEMGCWLSELACRHGEGQACKEYPHYCQAAVSQTRPAPSSQD